MVGVFVSGGGVVFRRRWEWLLYVGFFLILEVYGSSGVLGFFVGLGKDIVGFVVFFEY